MSTAKLEYTAKKAYMQITNSIAFYPVMITVGLFLLSLGVGHLDKISVGTSIINHVIFLKIDDANTARSLLSALLTGLISLVTFTFSMVMIVLSQVTSTFSPRLLPDLVSKKGNQLVLGIILGSICFITIALSNIKTMTAGPHVPVLSVALSMLLGLASLLSFMYFIHKISNEIQIGNIINSIYRTTRNVLDRELNSGSYHENWEENESFILVKAWDSGYFDSITQPQFRKKSRKLGLTARILKHQGMYLLKGDPFLEINQPMNDAIRTLLEENILLRHQEEVKENFFYGFKHITEIAVKALSPAVNDPGTAITAIDYLTDLLCRFQDLRGRKVLEHKDGTACIIYAPVPFESTFYLCLASIRAYSAKDVTVQARLINLISKLSERDERGEHQALYKRELASLEEASSKEMESKEDIAFIRSLIDDVKRNNGWD